MLRWLRVLSVRGPFGTNPMLTCAGSRDGHVVPPLLMATMSGVQQHTMMLVVVQ